MTDDVTPSPFDRWPTREAWEGHLRQCVPDGAADPEGLMRVLRRFRPTESADLSIGRGWDGLVIQLNDALAALDPGYTIDQVKQKFGGLRYYATPSSLDTAAAFHHLINAATRDSFRTCEQCGRPGTPTQTERGSYWTACPTCASGFDTRAAERILVLGDTHGDNSAIGAIHAAIQRWSPDLIVQVGDFGYWPGTGPQHFLANLDKACRKRGLRTIWVDGNHENHRRLGSATKDPGLYRMYGTTLFYAARGARLPMGAGEFPWLFLGGAHSTDRESRTEGRDWFPEEAASDAQFAAAEAGGPAHVVVTHDAPGGSRPLDEEMVSRHARTTPDQAERSAAHQADVARLLDAVHAAHHFHGHTHVRYEGRHGVTRIHGLGESTQPPSQWQLLVAADGTLLDDPFNAPSPGAP
jgi:predicted phosphodiesterase